MKKTPQLLEPSYISFVLTPAAICVVAVCTVIGLWWFLG